MNAWPWRLLMYRLALLLRRAAPICQHCGSGCQEFNGTVAWIWEVRRFVCVDCGSTNYYEWGAFGPAQGAA